MNSEVKTYDLNKPIKWKEFKKFPEDIQVEYWHNITTHYTTNRKWMAEMFGVSEYTITVWQKAHNIKSRHRGGFFDPKDRDRWLEFINQNRISEMPDARKPPIVFEAVQDEHNVAENVSDVIAEPMPEGDIQTELMPTEELPTPPAHKLEPQHNISDLIAALVGSGAKLTVEVIL